MTLQRPWEGASMLGDPWGHSWRVAVGGTRAQGTVPVGVQLAEYLFCPTPIIHDSGTRDELVLRAYGIAFSLLGSVPMSPCSPGTAGQSGSSTSSCPTCQRDRDPANKTRGACVFACTPAAEGNHRCETAVAISPLISSKCAGRMPANFVKESIFAIIHDPQ